MSKTLLSAPLATLEQGDDFIRRHLGPCSSELPGMLAGRMIRQNTLRLDTPKVYDVSISSCDTFFVTSMTIRVS